MSKLAALITSKVRLTEESLFQKVQLALRKAGSLACDGCHLGGGGGGGGGGRG